MHTHMNLLRPAWVILWGTFPARRRPSVSCGAVQFPAGMAPGASGDTSPHRGASVTTAPLVGSTTGRSRALRLRTPDPSKTDGEREVFQSRRKEEVGALTRLWGHTAGERTGRTPSGLWGEKLAFHGADRGERSDVVGSKPGAGSWRVREPTAAGHLDAAGMGVGLLSLTTSCRCHLFARLPSPSDCPLFLGRDQFFLVLLPCYP